MVKTEEISRRIVFAVFLAAAAVLYLPAWLSGGILRDAYDETQTLALLRWTAQEWLAGRVPLWNPYICCGYPAAAGLVAQAFYPPTLLIGLFPLPTAHILYYLLHHLLAFAGCYLLGRSHTWRRETCLTAGLAYSFGGWMLSKRLAGLLLYIAPASLLPFVLLALRRHAAGHRNPAYLGLWGGLFLLSAGPDIILFGVYLSLIYFIGLWYFSAARARFALTVLGGAALAGALGAVQWWLTLQFLPLTERWAIRSVEFSASFYLPAQHLLSFLLPRAFGSLAEGNYCGAASFVELLASPGAIIMFGALLALGRPNRRRLFWLAVAILSLLVALGPLTPLHRLIVTTLPGLSAMRRAARFLYLTSFALIMLGADELDRLISSPPHRRFLRPLAGIVALAGLLVFALGDRLSPLLAGLPHTYCRLAAPFGFSFLWQSALEFALLSAAFLLVLSATRLRAAARGLLLALLLLVQWIPIGLSFNNTYSMDVFFGERPASSKLAQGPGRVLLEQLGALSWYPADLQYRRIPSIQGYAGLYSLRQLALARKVEEGFSARDNRAGDRLAVAFRITSPGFDPGPGWSRLMGTNRGAIWRRDLPLPMAWTESGAPVPVERTAPGHIRLTAPVTPIVLSESYDPGWQVVSPGGMCRASSTPDGLLCVDTVPTGDIELVYRPEGFLPTACLSLLAGALCCALLRPRPASAPESRSEPSRPGTTRSAVP